MNKKILTGMASGIDAAQARLDPKSHKFLAANGGWAVTLNDIIFPLALLYSHAKSPVAGEDRVLELAMRGGDGLRKAQSPDGRWEFEKVDGSKWGQTYMPWTIYHWCEAFALLRDIMPAARRRAWEEGLTLCYDGLASELAAPRSHNIPTWNGMSLVRGAELFDRPQWAEVGKRQIDYAIDKQHPGGYWPEGDGPTNGYNGVYIHAVGLYHALTGDRSALACLKRAVNFRSTFAYPDGSAVETVDGRQRYHTGLAAMGLPGLSLFPNGRRLIALGLKSTGSKKIGLSPQWASYVQHGHTGEAPPLPQEGKTHREVYRKSALTRRSGPWFYTVSAYAPKPENRHSVAVTRWYMSRSNTLSVWHDAMGLLVGGGHSKHDPFFCTFEVWKDEAWIQEPTAARFSHAAGEDRIRLMYGDIACDLRIKPKGPKQLAITFAAPPASLKKAQIRAHFTLRLPPDSPIGWTGAGKSKVEANHTADPRRSIGVAWRPDDEFTKRTLAGKGWSIDMPSASSFHYPTYPFNPYAIDNAAGPNDALAVMVAELGMAGEQTFVIRVP